MEKKKKVTTNKKGLASQEKNFTVSNYFLEKDMTKTEIAESYKKGEEVYKICPISNYLKNIFFKIFEESEIAAPYVLQLQRGWYRQGLLETKILTIDKELFDSFWQLTMEIHSSGGLTEEAFQSSNVQSASKRYNEIAQELNTCLIEWLQPLLEQDELKIKNRATVRLPSNTAIAMLPNMRADRDIFRSLMAYPSWKINENLCLRAFDGREGNTVVYQPSEVSELLRSAPEKALEMLERKFGQIKNETVADVIDILFHHWHKHHDPTTNAAVISAADICKYRNKGSKGENLDLHWRALQDAFSISLRERSGNISAAVFFSEIVGEKQGAGAAYFYSPGFMLQYAMRGETLYFAPFMQKVWELDPIRHNEAKRIARYIRGDWRMNTEKYLIADSGAARAARYHTWAHILSESGIDVESHRKGKNPARLITAVERAIETLYQMEVLDENELDIYHGDDRKIAENLPPRGRLDTWLSLRVCLAPAADVREALIETDNKRRAGRARDAKAFSHERAKMSLKAKR